MKSKTFKIQNSLGIHARPAGQLVKTASKFNSSIYISKNGNEVNAKSIMGVLMLEAGFGSKITVRIEGEDETEALKALEEVIEKRHFDED
jgi:phosphocarrier protein